MLTATKLFERSMKSCRLNSVAFSWLHGGHHLAPQYTSTGLPSALPWAKAFSMSASAAAGCQVTWGPLATVAQAGAALKAARVMQAAVTARTRWDEEAMAGTGISGGGARHLRLSRWVT